MCSIQVEFKDLASNAMDNDKALTHVINECPGDTTESIYLSLRSVIIDITPTSSKAKDIALGAINSIPSNGALIVEDLTTALDYINKNYK